MQCTKLKTYMETGRVVFLPARAIRPNPAQPRQHFGGEALEGLAESIRTHGILQPLTVRRVGGCYELVAGERRLRAAIQAGLAEIPCIVMNMDSGSSATAALVENLQRQDLDFVEEAKGISRLMELTGKNQEQIASELGKSQSAVANKLRLLRHEERVLAALLEAELTERHARALLKLEGEQEKLMAIGEIKKQQMTVARAEQYIDALAAGKQEKTAKRGIPQFLSLINRNLMKMQLAGIPASTRRLETESEIILTITIPKGNS